MNIKHWKTTYMLSKLHWLSVGIRWKFTIQEVKDYSKTTAAAWITEPSRIKAHLSTCTQSFCHLTCVFLGVRLYKISPL